MGVAGVTAVLSGCDGDDGGPGVPVTTGTPVQVPTTRPTTQATTQPTGQATVRPTTQATSRPTTAPTTRPTTAPTAVPTVRPTVQPSFNAFYPASYQLVFMPVQGGFVGPTSVPPTPIVVNSAGVITPQVVTVTGVGSGTLRGRITLNSSTSATLAGSITGAQSAIDFNALLSTSSAVSPGNLSSNGVDLGTFTATRLTP